MIRGILLPVALLLPAVAVAEESEMAPRFRATVMLEDDRTGEGDRVAFSLSRTEFGASVAAGVWQLEAEAELVRSAEPGSLMGVAGNSYFIRPRQVALGTLQHLADDWRFGGSAGMLLRASSRLYAGDPLAELETGPSERTVGDDASDLGAELQVGFGGLAEMRLMALNGEGARDVERNRSKNIGGSLKLTPCGTEGCVGLLPTLEGFVEQGSAGAGEQETFRASGLVTVAHSIATARAEFGLAEGSTRLADATSAWWRTTVAAPLPMRGLEVVALYEAASPDDDVDGESRRMGGGLRWMAAPATLQPVVMLWAEHRTSDDAVALVPGAPSATEGQLLKIAFTLRGGVWPVGAR